MDLSESASRLLATLASSMSTPLVYRLRLCIRFVVLAQLIVGRYVPYSRNVRPFHTLVPAPESYSGRHIVA